MNSDRLIINGIEYSPVCRTKGNRNVVVVDKGWIFAGDVTRKNGRIYLSHAVWVFRWESCGFSKVIEDQKQADIREIADVDIPKGSEIFCIPVTDDWGL
jgi:hypothetical protein